MWLDLFSQIKNLPSMTHGSRGRLSTMSLCSINEHLKCSCHVIIIYHIYIYIYMYIYTYIYIYIYIYIYTYTYTYILFHNILQIYPNYIQVSHFFKNCIPNDVPMTSQAALAQAHPKIRHQTLLHGYQIITQARLRCFWGDEWVFFMVIIVQNPVKSINIH